MCLFLVGYLYIYGSFFSPFPFLFLVCSKRELSCTCTGLKYNTSISPKYYMGVLMVKHMCNYCGIGSDVCISANIIYNLLIPHLLHSKCTCKSVVCVYMYMYVHVCIHTHLAEYIGKEGHWRDFSIYMYIIYALSRVQSVVGLSPTQGSYVHVCVLMRDEKEGRKKQARSNKQQLRQSNTAHPRQSLFLTKMSCLGWDSNPRHSTL